MRYCSRCKDVVIASNRSQFYCKDCSREVRLERKRLDSKRYYQENKEKIVAWNREYEKTHRKERQQTYKKYRNRQEYKDYSRNRYHSMEEARKKARYHVSNAVRDGKLQRATHCESCGVKDWGMKRSMIEAHHYRGYEPDHWLDVQWLCVPCHKTADRREGGGLS